MIKGNCPKWQDCVRRQDLRAASDLVTDRLRSHPQDSLAHTPPSPPNLLSEARPSDQMTPSAREARRQSHMGEEHPSCGHRPEPGDSGAHTCGTCLLA